MHYPMPLEPVGLVGWALLACIALAFRARARALGAVLVALSLFYFWIASPLGANVMLGWLEHHPTAAANCGPPTEGQTVVVLAGGIDEALDDQAPTDVGRLHGATLRRVLGGVEAARASHGRLVLAGGAGDDVREADLMAELAARLGIERERIVVERDSANTYENAQRVAGLLRADTQPAGRLRLVTSALHMPRAIGSFRAAGLDVCAHPLDRRWVNPPAPAAFVPQISALRKSSDAIYELMGLVAYRAQGRIGGP
jgi:uncharacterized SAM-binding protein YcdF (DUF218 family)